MFLIPAAIAGATVLASGTGVACGVRAANTFHKAHQRRDEAAVELESCQERYQAVLREVVLELADYGEAKSAAIQGPITRLRDYITASGRCVSIADLEHLDELVDSLPDLENPKLDAGLVELLMQLGIGVSAGTAARAGVFALVGALGTASTGAPIAGLSGAAATNATMAAIGGGAVAAGGGGVALGGLVLGGVVAGSALLMLGLGLMQQSEKYQTAIADFAAAVSVIGEETLQYEADKPFVLGRIAEMRDAVVLLAWLLDRQLDRLARLDLGDRRTHRDFAIAMALASALARLLRTPVFGEDGRLGPQTAAAASAARRAADEAKKQAQENKDPEGDR